MLRIPANCEQSVFIVSLYMKCGCSVNNALHFHYLCHLFTTLSLYRQKQLIVKQNLKKSNTEHLKITK